MNARLSPHDAHAMDDVHHVEDVPHAHGALRDARPVEPGRPSSAGFCGIRAASARLAAPLSAEDCAIQSMPDASPVKWHLAHTSWFFETFVLAASVAGYRPFNPSFRMLFNSYYNGVGEKHPRPKRGLLSRPSLDEVFAYRSHVDAAMCELLERDGLASDVAALITLGLNHEQQHQELILTDVLHLLSCSPLHPAYASSLGSIDAPQGASALHGASAAAADADARPLTWTEFDEGIVEVGHDGAGFAFDNETPRHRQYLDAFLLASRPVTSGEYAAFVDDGGYRRPELWLSEGWDWVNASASDAPLYWQREADHWLEFGLHGLQPLRTAAPVCHVTLYEADAYARWAAARLPSEAEWEIAARGKAVDGNFVESGILAPQASEPTADTPQQLFGDVWEWTRSAYTPYPGYRSASGAIGEYNGKFMCNQHVLRGGSCVSPRSHLRATYRNFFPAGARWQFTGIRLARDSA